MSKVDVRLKEIIAEVCVETGSELLEMEIIPDHVHLLVECDPQFGINRLIRSIKGRSSRVSLEELRRTIGVAQRVSTSALTDSLLVDQ